MSAVVIRKRLVGNVPVSCISINGGMLIGDMASMCIRSTFKRVMIRQGRSLKSTFSVLRWEEAFGMNLTPTEVEQHYG